MKYPRVLIIGETFRLNGGGGITMSNLFKEWPGEKIAVITDKIAETNAGTPYTYYQLGNDEIKFPFPFSLIQAYYASGPYIFNAAVKIDASVDSKKGILQCVKGIIHPSFDYLLKLTGLISHFYRIRTSDALINWIKDFNPEIIYIQPFHHNIMRFGNLLFRTLKIPYVIHIMDDSVKYINQSVINRGYCQHLIEKDFKELIDNAKGHMCISDAMSAEYLHRYGKIFLPFRNPIEIDKWIPFQKRNLEVDPHTLRIIYTGRLFSPTIDTLIDFCKVIDRLNKNNKNVVLDIFTHDKNPSFNNIIRHLKGTKFCEPVEVGEIPRIIQQYDIFFLCLDFNEKATKYSQFSISTRTSEAMISGIPILVYAPSNSAQYIYFNENDCGCLVGERDPVILNESIMKLWNDFSFRERISSNAIKKAMLDSEASGVRERFVKALANS